MLRSPSSVVSILMAAAALASMPFLSSQEATAALRTLPFTAYRPADGDRFLNVLFTYDDAAAITIATPGGGSAAPDGGIYGQPCGMSETSPPYSPGSCYLKNIDNAISPWSSIQTFTGYPIISVTGQYWEREPSGGHEIYNIIGLAQVGSYEGGVTGSLPTPRIPHFISDNLIQPSLLQIISDGSFSQGGIVLLTSNPDYSYHLFSDPSTGKLAGCGSGTCNIVEKVLPIPISFSVDGGAYNPRRDGSEASFPLPNPAEGLLQPQPLHPSPNDVYALSSVAGAQGKPTEGEIFQSSGQTSGQNLILPPDQTNVDRLSAALGLSACPGGGPTYIGPFDPNLGAPLPCGAPGGKGVFGLVPNDNIISLSYGKDSGEVLEFSVDPDAIGVVGSDVNLHSTLIPNLTPPPIPPTNPDVALGMVPAQNGNEAAGDIYLSRRFSKFGAYRDDHLAAGHFLLPVKNGLNGLYRDESELGLQAPANLGSALGSPEDNLDALEEADTGDAFWGVDSTGSLPNQPDGIPERPVFFSLDPASPSIGTATQRNGGSIPLFTDANDPDVSADDILVSGLQPLGASFAYGIYASGVINLGLQPGDILDALVLSDIGGVGTGPSGLAPNGILNPYMPGLTLFDEALFSLAKGSPTLDSLMYKPGDVFYTKFNGSFSLYASHASLGLLATDELDALDIKPVPGPLPLLGAGMALRFSRKLRAASRRQVKWRLG